MATVISSIWCVHLYLFYTARLLMAHLKMKDNRLHILYINLLSMLYVYTVYACKVH